MASNLDRGNSPGNIVLRKGEAHFPKPNVVNITQLFTVDKHDPAEKVKTPSARRVREILEGFRWLLEPRDPW